MLFKCVLFLQANPDFQKFITQTRNDIFSCGFLHHYISTRSIKITNFAFGTIKFPGPLPPSAGAYPAFHLGYAPLASEASPSPDAGVWGRKPPAGSRGSASVGIQIPGGRGQRPGGGPGFSGPGGPGGEAPEKILDLGSFWMLEKHHKIFQLERKKILVMLNNSIHMTI